MWICIYSRYPISNIRKIYLLVSMNHTIEIQKPLFLNFSTSFHPHPPLHPFIPPSTPTPPSTGTRTHAPTFASNTTIFTKPLPHPPPSLSLSIHSSQSTPLNPHLLPPKPSSPHPPNPPKSHSPNSHNRTPLLSVFQSRSVFLHTNAVAVAVAVALLVFIFFFGRDWKRLEIGDGERGMESGSGGLEDFGFGYIHGKPRLSLSIYIYTLSSGISMFLGW